MTTSAITATHRQGIVSYRLERHRTLREFRDGRHEVGDLCDATAELKRVVRHHGQSMAECCPICDQEKLYLVYFVFGAGLPPSGRVVSSTSDLSELRQQHDSYNCYCVEVCQHCWWNHLRESFTVAQVRDVAGLDL